MKRRSESEASIHDGQQDRALKRSNSSLFSIVTIASSGSICPEDVNDKSKVDYGSKGDEVGAGVGGGIATSTGRPMRKSSLVVGSSSLDLHAVPEGLPSPSLSNPPPSLLTTSTDNDDYNDRTGFYIDEDDEDQSGGDSKKYGAKASICAPSSSADEPTKSKYLPGPSAIPIKPSSLVSSPLSSSLSSPMTSPTPSLQNNNDNATGLIFESSMKHYDRYNPLHKERSLRVTSVREYLMNKKSTPQRLLERCIVFGYDEDGSTNNESNDERGEVDNSNAGSNGSAATGGELCQRMYKERSFLDDDDYLRVHLPGYMSRLDRLSRCTCTNKLDREAEQYKSIYFTPDSVSAAKNAAASLCHLVSNVVDGKLDNGFAIIRPPGHHAEPGLAGGYCIINNVAVAAAYAKDKLGLSRILIVDWDVHHGNGTATIFFDDPEVLYFSVHRYHGGNYFPFLQNGGPTTVGGSGDAAGRNVNVGWNQKGMGDAEYLAVWRTILMPMAREFNPDLVLVSAGFDSALGDMGECNVTPECYRRLTGDLMTLAGGKVVCTLEGGYVRSVLCRCVESVVGMLLRDGASCCQGDAGDSNNINSSLAATKQSTEDVLSSINPTAAKSIRATITAHIPYWNCFGEDLCIAD